MRAVWGLGVGRRRTPQWWRVGVCNAGSLGCRHEETDAVRGSAHQGQRGLHCTQGCLGSKRLAFHPAQWVVRRRLAPRVTPKGPMDVATWCRARCAHQSGPVPPRAVWAELYSHLAGAVFSCSPASPTRFERGRFPHASPTQARRGHPHTQARWGITTWRPARCVHRPGQGAARNSGGLNTSKILCCA